MAGNLTQWRKLTRAVAYISFMKLVMKASFAGAVLYCNIFDQETKEGRKETNPEEPLYTEDNAQDDKRFNPIIIIGVYDIRSDVSFWVSLAEMLIRMTAYTLAVHCLLTATGENSDLGQALKKARVWFYITVILLIYGIVGFTYVNDYWVLLLMVALDLIMIFIVEIFISHLESAIDQSKTALSPDKIIVKKQIK